MLNKDNLKLDSFANIFSQPRSLEEYKQFLYKQNRNPDLNNEEELLFTYRLS